MTRPSDQLQNLADRLSEDIVAMSPEMLAAEVAHEPRNGAGLALDFDRIVMRAEQQARWRRVGQRLRALVPSTVLRPWRPAMAAVAGIAVMLAAGGVYLNVRPDEPRAPLAPVAATPQPSAPFAAAVERAPRRERTVRMPAATITPNPPAASTSVAPATMDARSLAPADRQRAVAEAPSASRLQSEMRVASAPAPGAAVVDRASRSRNAVPSFAWPVRGHVTADAVAAKAGPRNGGIDIAVPVGTDVLAAADGVVIYTGNGGQSSGNLILVRHDGGFVTAYAHVDMILVKVNDRVHRGQVIAKSGRTGTAATPRLHFEIRKGDAPVDARRYLPPM